MNIPLELTVDSICVAIKSCLFEVKISVDDSVNEFANDWDDIKPMVNIGVVLPVEYSSNAG